MATPWSDVYNSTEYKQLPLSEQVQAKLQYFNDVVAPNVDDVDIPEAKRQFISYTNDLDKPKQGVLSTLGEGASRVGGVVLGTANAPLAFIQGMQNAPYIEGSPEEWNKLPWYQKPLVMLGGGFESAVRSIGKQGDFGEQYDSYYKAKTGKTLEQDFGKGANYLRLALDLTRDPMVGPALGMDLAKQGVKTVGQFVNYLKRGTVELGANEVIKTPKGMLSDIDNLSKLDDIEKTELKQQIVDLVSERLHGKASGQGVKVGDNFMAYDTPASSPFSPELSEELKNLNRPALPDPGIKPVSLGKEAIVGDKPLPPRGAGAEIVGDYIAPKGVANTVDVFSDTPIPPPKPKVEPPIPEIAKPGATSGAIKPNTGDMYWPESEEALYAFSEMKDQLRNATTKTVTEVEGDVFIAGSGYPQWFRDISKKHKISANETTAIIDKYLLGKKELTDRQADIFSDIVSAAKKEAEPYARFKAEIEGIDPGRIRESGESVKARLLEEVKREGIDEETALAELNTFFDDVSKGKPAPANLTGELPGISARETFSLANPETEIGVIQSKKNMTPTGSMFSHGVGVIAGVDVDKDGNLTYDFAKGAGGAALGIAGFKMAPFIKKSAAAQKLYAKNPNWGKVHDMIGQEKSSFSLMGLWNDVMKTGIDRFDPIRNVSKETYDAAIKFQSYKDVSEIKLKELGPYFQPFGKKDEVVVTEYILAKRALNRAENGIKNPNNVTLEQASKAIEEIEATYQAKGGDVANLRAAADGFHNWAQRNILKEALDSGFISQEAYDSIKANNQFYATFDVLAHLPEDINKLPMMPSAEYFSKSNQSIIKAMKGTEKAIDDPIKATVRKFVGAQAAFAKNKVASIFIDDMLTNPDPAKQAMIRPLAQNKKEFDIMTKQGMNPVASMPDGWDTINRFKDGYVEKFVVPKEISASMKQMAPWQAPQAVQAVNAIFRSTATTLYLPFTIGNAVRDAFMAFVTSPVYRGAETVKFPVDWIKGFGEGLKHEFLGNSKAVEGYLKHGGGFGWSGEVKDAVAVKERLFKGKLDIVKDQTNLFKQIEKLSGAVELAPRLAIYERAMKQGATMDEATSLARKGTIDFNRAGSALKVFNQFVPFLNARVQSRVVLAEALKRDPKSTLTKAFFSTALPGAALYAYNRTHYSDLYDDIPKYTRDNYFTFITGETTDEKGNMVPKYFVIPKGDIGQMVWNPIEHTVEKMWKDDKTSTMSFLTQFVSDLSPVGFARDGNLSASLAASNVTPPAVKAVYENITNKNLYTGQDVVPYFMEKNKPPELQFKEKTPETYKKIARELKDNLNISVSPLKIQNFMSNIIAGYGREGLDPAAMMRGLKGRFYKKEGGQKERDTWNIIKDIETGYNTTRSYAEEFVKNGDRASALKLMQGWNGGIDKAIGRMEKEGIADEGGVRRDYFFTFDKMKGIMQTGLDTRTPLKRKISAR